MPNGGTLRPIEEVLADKGEGLRRLPGVVGTAIGLHEGAPCIRVLVTGAEVARRHRFPQQLEGYALRVEVTGPIHPRSADDGPLGTPHGAP